MGKIKGERKKEKDESGTVEIRQGLLRRCAPRYDITTKVGLLVASLLAMTLQVGLWKLVRSESNYWLRIIKRTVTDIDQVELDYLSGHKTSFERMIVH